MRPSAFFLDLDGTLLDTLTDLADAINNTLAREGYPVHPVPAFTRFVGDGAYELCTRVLPPEARTPEIIKEMIVGFDNEYATNWHAKTRPYPGAEVFLGQMKTAGVPLAVLSNKPHSFATLMVQHFFPDFSGPVLGNKPEFLPKPDPQGALWLAAQMDIEPGRIALIGDSDIDIYTARNAGMQAWGAAWGFRGKEELSQAGAEVILRDWPTLYRYAINLSSK